MRITPLQLYTFLIIGMVSYFISTSTIGLYEVANLKSSVEIINIEIADGIQTITYSTTYKEKTSIIQALLPENADFKDHIQTNHDSIANKHLFTMIVYPLIAIFALFVTRALCNKYDKKLKSKERE